MKISLFFLSLFIPLLSAGQDFLLVNANAELYAIEMATCERTFIVDINSPGGVSVGDLTFTPDGTLWGIGTNGSLFTIDQASGNTNVVAFFPFTGLIYTSLVADANGLLYIAEQAGGLYTYDSLNDEITFLGDVGPGAAGDLTFVDGTLVMASVDNTMIQIDLQNPSNSSVLLDFAINNNIFGVVTFVEDCENTVTYATDSGGSVYEIDFETETLTELCDFSTSAFGAASALEFLAATPITIEDTIITNTSCVAAEGIIEIIATGSSAILYSLDGINFQSSNIFTGLASGTYTIYLEDENNCTEEIEIEVGTIGEAPEIMELITTPALCGESSGSMEIIIEGGQFPYVFVLDGDPVSNNGVINNLAAGTYELEVFDAIGCRDVSIVTIEGTPPLEISTVEISACGGGNNEIRVIPVGGSFNYMYRLNGSALQSSSQFENLPAGPFTVEVEDSDGCTATFNGQIPELEPLELEIESLTACGPESSFFSLSASGGNDGYLYSLNNGPTQSSPLFENISAGTFAMLVEDQAGCVSEVLNVTIPEKEGLQISDLESSPDECGKNSGSISFNTTGGSLPLSYNFNGQSQASPPFTNLISGPYVLEVIDADGCLINDTTLVGSLCPIYIPNAFSPNGDGRNDLFQVYSGVNIEIISYQIFNRWGGLVYEANDFSTSSTGSFWDGTFNGALLNPDLYVYTIQLINGEGREEQFEGGITLVR